METQIFRDGKLETLTEEEVKVIQQAIPAPDAVPVSNPVPDAAPDPAPVSNPDAVPATDPYPEPMKRENPFIAQRETMQSHDPQPESFSLSKPPESPMAFLMASILNPSSANLEKMSGMFSGYLTSLPLPAYVKEAGQAFIDSLLRWSREQKEAANVQ